MKRMSTHLLLALGLALLAGCSSSSSSSPTGSAQLAVSVPQALSSSVSRVSVTVSAADFSSVSVDLVSANGVWGGTLGNLPAGSYRTFLAQAFDSSGTLLFQGSASGVSIVSNQTALVALTLQQANAPPPFQNEAPVIDSLAAPSTSVPSGGSLSLVATTHDPNPGDTLSYAWSSTAGSFSSASEASTSWAAPTSSGFQTLTFTVTDSKGLSTSISLVVYVTPGALQGNAQLSISFNSFPQVTSLGSAPTQLAVGQTTSVSASASDLDGDSLSYSWSASCAGSWANATSPSAQFTPSALPADACNNCRLTVSVSDGRGGQSTSTVALCIISPPAPKHFNPFITSASGSSSTVSPGQVITYEVTASDPEGSALTFSWAASPGSLSTPTTDASSSRITWTIPSCVSEGTTPAISATVTNAFNLTATQRFSVTGPLPVCGWAWTGAMASPRSQHTATLLPNGKVLVSGGRDSGAAEVYDPTSGTWSATGSMLAPREGATATLLLNGKVLVSAGAPSNARFEFEEVYDPASGTWSATRPVISPRVFHTATLLLDGTVLVSGGFSAGPTGNASVSEVYDPASGTWRAVGAMRVSRSFHTATRLLDGKVLVSGGQGNSDPATAEVYDPASGTWSATGSMAEPRFFHTATLLPDGKVLVSGGVGRNNPVAEAEVYDPASGTWSATASMTEPRLQHTATLLPNGKVLVIGGQSNSGTLATAEVYDPASGTWSATASLAEPRSWHAATLLPNDKILISGGQGNSGTLETVGLYTY